MKVGCSNCFAPGDEVQWRWWCLVGDWKIQFTGVFPLFTATDAALDRKNALVSSQNAFSTKGLIIIRFFKSWQIWHQDFQFAVPGCLSWLWIQIFSITDLGSQMLIFSIPIQIFSSWIPDPGSTSLSIETQKNWFFSFQKYDPGSSSRIQILNPDPDFYPFRIPILDSGSWFQG